MNISGHIRPMKHPVWQLKLALAIVILFVVLSLLAPILANRKPIVVSSDSDVFYPLFSQSNWQTVCEEQPCDYVYPLIPFSPQELEIETRLKPPGSPSVKRSVHWLGTDELGRDVLATIVHGSRTSLWIGLPAAGLALVFGTFYGLICGYFGDDKKRIGRVNLLVFVLLSFVVLFGMKFYLNRHPEVNMNFPLLLGSILLLMLLDWLWQKVWSRKGGRSDVRLPIDSMGMRVVDMVKALPPLFIVLFALQLLDRPSQWNLIFLIAYLLWATFARHSRAEVLRIRNRPSVYNALLTGRSDFWIWWNELLPYIIRPLLVTLAFSLASAILLEATLSFLGIGLPAEHVSWGTMINAARQHPDAWWLLIWPGICLVSLIWSVQYLGHALEARLRFGQGVRSA